MKRDIERNLGEQPITGVLRELDLKANDLVSASADQITHKMVARACKGRRLTPNVKSKILNALSACTGKTFTKADLFTY